MIIKVEDRVDMRICESKERYYKYYLHKYKCTRCENEYIAVKKTKCGNFVCDELDKLENEHKIRQQL